MMRKKITRRPEDDPLKVADVMERDLTSVADTTTLLEAMAMMSSHRTTGLPVLDADGTVVGFIGAKDVLKATIPGYVGYIDESFSMPSIDTIKKRVKAVGSSPVSEHMTADPVIFSEDDDLTSALVAIFKRDIHRAPVARDGYLVGIVGREAVIEGFVRSNFDDGEVAIPVG